MSNVTKSAFVLGLSMDLAIDEVIRLGAEQGIELTPQSVSSIRYQARKKSGTPTRKYTRKVGPKAPDLTDIAASAANAAKLLSDAGVKVKRGDLRKQLAQIQRERKAQEKAAAEANTQIADLSTREATIQALLA